MREPLSLEAQKNSKDLTSNIGMATDRVEKRYGWDLTGRVTYLPEENIKQRRLTHLGLSYTHQFRRKRGDENELPRVRNGYADIVILRLQFGF